MKFWGLNFNVLAMTVSCIKKGLPYATGHAPVARRWLVRDFNCKDLRCYTRCKLFKKAHAFESPYKYDEVRSGGTLHQHTIAVGEVQLKQIARGYTFQLPGRPSAIFFHPTSERGSVRCKSKQRGVTVAKGGRRRKTSACQMAQSQKGSQSTSPTTPLAKKSCHLVKCPVQVAQS